jgi:predicted DNA-binding ribbon-helix-helix protein
MVSAMNKPTKFTNHPGRRGTGRSLTRKTVRLDDDTYRQLLLFARQRGITLSSLIREALDRHVVWMKGGER